MIASSGTLSARFLFTSYVFFLMSPLFMPLVHAETAPGYAGAILVTDAVAPEEDRNLPFGTIQLHEQQTEWVRIDNIHDRYSVTLDRLFMGGWYYENFEDNEAQDWTPDVPAHWLVTEGVYYGRAAQPETWMHTHYSGELWRDIAAGTRSWRLGGQTYTTVIFLRASEDFDVGLETGNGYALGLGSNAFWVGKVVNDVFTMLQNWAYCPYLFNDGTPNDAVFSVADTHLRAYINGILVWTGADASLQEAGVCGVGGYSGSAETEAIHCFDFFTAGPPRRDDGETPEQSAGRIAHVGSDSTEKEVTPSFPVDNSATPDLHGLTLAPLSGPFAVVDAPELPHTIAPGESLLIQIGRAHV